MNTLITMKHVAEASGVSQATVSQVLNGKAVRHRISSDTQVRVRKVANELGYRRNQSARAMRLGRFMAVGFVVAPDERFFGFARHPRMVRGLAASCVDHDSYLRLVVLQPGDKDPTLYLRETFQELGVDGLVIGEEGAITPALEDAIRRYRVPALWANVLRDDNAVVPDEASGVSGVVQEFVRLGHRHLAYVDAPRSNHFSWQLRRDTFESVARKAGCEAGVLGADLDVHIATRQIIAMLRGQNGPTAILANSGERAQAVLWSAREVGLDVPKDLSIVALDDHHFNNVGLNLTYKRIPFMEVGHAVGNLLQQKIDRPDEAMMTRLVPYGELKSGKSLGPAPESTALS